MLYTEILTVIGALFEIIGVFLMANTYINTGIFERLLIMFGSLFNHKDAKNASKIFSMTVETEKRILKSIKGLTLIAIGFILQLVAILTPIIERLNTAN